MATNHRPKSPERVHTEMSVQDGNASHNQTRPQGERLDDINRPKGCIFPCPDTQIIQALPQIRVEPDHIPVQSTMLRTEYSSIRVHESLQTSVNSRPPTRLQTLSLPGRLASGSTIATRGSNSNPVRSGNLQPARLISQPGQVRAATNSEDNLPRHATRHCRVQGQTFGRQVTETRRRVTVYLARRDTHGEDLPQSHGTHGVLGKAHAASASKNQTAATTPSGLLVNRPGYGDQGPIIARGPRSDPMVAKQGEPHRRDEDSSRTARSPTLHRCIESRLGSPRSRAPSTGSLVSTTTKLAHQLPGTGGSVERATGVQDKTGEIACSSNDGQHYGSRPNKKSGGDSLAPAYAADDGTPDLGTKTPDHPNRETRTGTSQCHSGQSKQERATPSGRMVIEPKCLSAALEDLGEAKHRSVCAKQQQEATPLRKPSGRRSGHRARRSVSTVGRTGSLRIPSNNTDPSSSAETSIVKSIEDDPHRPLLAKPNLVSSASGTSNSRSKKPRQLANTTQAVGQVPRIPRGTQPTRLEVVVSGYRKAGFSKDAATRMARATRQSTNKVYQSKWQYFASWCHGQKTSPLKATIPLIADFLLHLRDEKNFTVSTIKGYRSAIALALKTVNTDVSSSPELTALLRAMAGEIPPKQLAPPKWNLTLVLETLISSPYEPLEEASLKFLTHKCVFLLALASAKRVSELQALSGSIAHKEDWSVVSFDFARDFLAKTEVPSSTRKFVRAFQIPALSKFSSEHNDQLLCPVRALRIYYRRTADRRTQHSRLLIPVLGTRTAVSKNTISAWITSVIRRAYMHLHNDLQTLHCISAHEVRAIATSWHFHHTMSLENVMRAASWRTHSTFSSYYLRDVAMIADGLMQLGPIVAAQHAL